MLKRKNPSTEPFITIIPLSVNVAQGADARFTATVAGSDDKAVAWSLDPASGAGTIDQTGLYTPPVGAGGSVSVIATSKADSSESATATATY